MVQYLIDEEDLKIIEVILEAAGKDMPCMMRRIREKPMERQHLKLKVVPAEWGSRDPSLREYASGNPPVF